MEIIEQRINELTKTLMKFTNEIIVVAIILLTLWTIPYCLSQVIKGEDVQIYLTIIMSQIPAYIKVIKYLWEEK